VEMSESAVLECGFLGKVPESGCQLEGGWGDCSEGMSVGTESFL